MAPAQKRLAIDLSGSVIRILEGSMGGPMNSGSAAVLEGALVGGKVVNPSAVGQTIKQLLARTEVTETRALVAICDSIATFRVLSLPASATEREVEAAVAHELPADPERLNARWVEVGGASDERLVYAVAYDRALFEKAAEAVRLAGLSASVIELKSASVARTVPDSACVVVDLAADPVEIVLIDQKVPRLWHTFKLEHQLTDDAAPALAAPLRSVLRFYRRSERGAFGQGASVYFSGEQVLPGQLLSQVSELVGQPVAMLPQPPRVPNTLRFPIYLGCIGLMMRRTL